MNDAADINPWMDTTCRANFPQPRQRWNTVAPEVITYPRPSWRMNVEARIRVALQMMLPHEERRIEGVMVIRDTAHPEHGSDLYYWIDGKRVKTFEQAVHRIAEIVQPQAKGDGE